MIVVVNSKITDQRFYNFVRYNLNNDDRLSVAKYCFASFAPLAPIVSKFIFHLDLAEFGHRQQELQAWLEQVLPKDKLSIHWTRCNNIVDWRNACAEIDAVGDDIIFPATWEDHIFWDCDIKRLQEGIELIKNDPDVNACVLTSHYPECMRYAVAKGAVLIEPGNYAVYEGHDDSGLRIMKLDFFKWQLTHEQDLNKLVFRVENFMSPPGPITRTYQPMKEQFRHFDGYSHVGIGGDIVAPLEIPPGFFTGMTVRYGFDDYDENAININPLLPLRTVDGVNGVDYKFMLKDMPAFWQEHIKEIVVADNIINQLLIIARNQYYISMSQINFDSAYGLFNDAHSAVPIHWVDNHMRLTTE